MTRFVVGRPVVTREPAVEVDAGLPVGLHRFQLVALNAGGQTSAPVVALVQVRELTGPPGIAASDPATPAASRRSRKKRSNS